MINIPTKKINKTWLTLERLQKTLGKHHKTVSSYMVWGAKRGSLSHLGLYLYLRQWLTGRMSTLTVNHLVERRGNGLCSFWKSKVVVSPSDGVPQTIRCCPVGWSAVATANWTLTGLSAGPKSDCEFSSIIVVILHSISLANTCCITMILHWNIVMKMTNYGVWTLTEWRTQRRAARVQFALCTDAGVVDETLFPLMMAIMVLS